MFGIQGMGLRGVEDLGFGVWYSDRGVSFGLESRI